MSKDSPRYSVILLSYKLNRISIHVGELTSAMVEGVWMYIDLECGLKMRPRKSKVKLTQRDRPHVAWRWQNALTLRVIFQTVYDLASPAGKSSFHVVLKVGGRLLLPC